MLLLVVRMMTIGEGKMQPRPDNVSQILDGKTASAAGIAAKTAVGAAIGTVGGRRIGARAAVAVEVEAGNGKGIATLHAAAIRMGQAAAAAIGTRMTIDKAVLNE